MDYIVTAMPYPKIAKLNFSASMEQAVDPHGLLNARKKT
jgi:hypothetical protein